MLIRTKKNCFYDGQFNEAAFHNQTVLLTDSLFISNFSSFIAINKLAIYYEMMVNLIHKQTFLRKKNSQQIGQTALTFRKQNVS